MKLAHISDIHWGKGWMHSRESLDGAVEQIKAESPDLILVTGDLTDWGLEFEFVGVKEYLDGIGIPYLAVPGNHDARHTGYKVFESLFCAEHERSFTKRVEDVLFVGLDSSDPDLDTGHIGREQQEWLDSELGSTDLTPLVCLHHHIVSVPNTGRERNTLIDAGDLLNVLDRHRVPLVLTGHKHFPWYWKVNDTVICNAGTVSCERRAYPNSFNFIEFGGEGFTIDRQLVMERKRERLGEFSTSSRE